LEKGGFVFIKRNHFYGGFSFGRGKTFAAKRKRYLEIKKNIPQFSFHFSLAKQKIKNI
jgi:hypothetical protein